MELAALSQLYSRSIVVFVESESRVEEKIFPCSAESNSTTADELTNPVRDQTFTDISTLWCVFHAAYLPPHLCHHHFLPRSCWLISMATTTIVSAQLSTKKL